MAQDKTHFQLLRSLHKFNGRDNEYSEWKYTTRRTLALYRPDINKLLGDSWRPRPIYEDGDQEDGDQDGRDQENEDGEDDEDRDGQDAAYEDALLKLGSAESAALEARQKADIAQKAIDDANDEQTHITRAMQESADTTAQLATQAETIAQLIKDSLPRKRSSKGRQGSRARSTPRRSSLTGRSRTVILSTIQYTISCIDWARKVYFATTCTCGRIEWQRIGCMERPRIKIPASGRTSETEPGT